MGERERGEGEKKREKRKVKKKTHHNRCGEKEKDEKLIGIKSGGLHFF